MTTRLSLTVLALLVGGAAIAADVATTIDTDARSRLEAAIAKAQNELRTAGFDRTITIIRREHAAGRVIGAAFRARFGDRHRITVLCEPDCEPLKIAVFDGNGRVLAGAEGLSGLTLDLPQGARRKPLALARVPACKAETCQLRVIVHARKDERRGA